MQIISYRNGRIMMSSIKSKEDKQFKVSHDEKCGGIYIKISIDEFNKLGFNFGDSIDVIFSNGFKMIDIPYYNGYYVKAGEPLLVGYPGYEYIRVGLNYGDDLWELANITIDTTCSIYLNKAKKYIDIQKIREVHYTDEQGIMPDEVFANFRPMDIGNLKKNYIYRGASPIDNKYKRASVSDKLMKKNNIKYIVDLVDNDREILEFSSRSEFNSHYFMSLYNNKKVTILSMSMQYKSETFSKKLIKGLIDMSNNYGPYFIHCQEGKDRTGYFCMVIGALGGATYNELVDDYMKTYDNYYKIKENNSKEKYELIKKANIDDMILYITGENSIPNLKDANISELATNYLIKIGMDENQIKVLKSKIINFKK